MFIQFEETPNPNTLKFLPGQPVLNSGSRDFKTEEDAAVSPLAKMLFEINGVTGVFFGADFVSVTKDADATWDTVKAHVLGRIMEHYTTGLPVMNDESCLSADMTDDEDLDEVSKQIKVLLAERVLPAVAMDGGHIEFVRFDDGIVYLRLEGACSGCPSSSVTLKMGIENMLKHYVPEVQSVEQDRSFM
jgi:Fe-S cluster biogenesis protein NfuA